MAHTTIDEIQAMTLDEVMGLNPEVMNINGHDVYLVDLGGRFGFSALVFRNGKHLYYANDYELHHSNKNHDELVKWYKDTMNNKLFSDAMIAAPITDYINGEKKDEYLRDYYPLMCDDKISAFNIFHNDKERADFERSIKDKIFNPIGFFYTSDKEFSNRLFELYNIAQESKKPQKDNYNYWLEAFKYEMFNHEYAINWEADTDTLGAFGNIPTDIYRKFDRSNDLNVLFDYLEFSDIQRKAYMEARKYVIENSNF